MHTRTHANIHGDKCEGGGRGMKAGLTVKANILPKTPTFTLVWNAIYFNNQIIKLR